MTNEKKMNCTFCSLGCGLIVRSLGGRPVELDYDMENPVNHGALCPRGNYVFEMLSDPSRMSRFAVREDRTLRTVSREGSIQFIASKLSEIKKAHGPAAIGVVLGADMPAEDIYSAYKLFKRALGTDNIDVALPLEDAGMLSSSARKMSFKIKDRKIDDIDDSDALIIIGDILTRSPVLSRRINSVKYKRKGRIISIDPERSHTSWFATTHLAARPGTESLLMLGVVKSLIDQKAGNSGKFKKYFEGVNLKDISKDTGIPADLIVRAAKEFSEAKKGTIILVPGFRDGLLLELSNTVAHISGADKGVIPFYSSGGSIGAKKIMDSVRGRSALTYSEMIDEAAKGKIKALLFLGADPLSSVPRETTQKAISNLKFILAAGLYSTPITDYADAIVPLSFALDEIWTMSAPDLALELCKKMRSRPAKESDLAAGARKALRSNACKSKFLISRVVSESERIELPKTSEKYPFILYVKDDIVHSSDGSVTSKHYWAMRECPSPYVEINEDDAKDYGVTDGSRVILKTGDGEIILNARITTCFPRGVLAVPHHFKEIRELLPIKMNEASRSYAISYGAASVTRVG